MKARVFAAAMASMAVLSTACSSSSESPSNEQVVDLGSAPSSDVVRVGWLTEGLTGFVKDVPDAFADADYGLEWVEFDSSASMMEALSAGAIDIAAESQLPIAILAQGNAESDWTEETAPIKIVAAWEYSDNPGFALMVRDTNITDASGLTGKKIAFSRGTVAHAFWTLLEKEYGLVDVEEVIVPAPEGRAAFQAGAVDALITGQTNALALEEKGVGSIIDNSGRSLGSFCVTLVRREVLDNEATVEHIEDFLDRFGAAYETVIADLEPAVLREMEKIDVSRSVAERSTFFKTIRRVPLDSSILEVLRKIVGAFFESGVIAKNVDPSLLIDDRFESGVAE